MSDHMQPMAFHQLMEWMQTEFRTHHSVFGIHETLFFRSAKESRIRARMYGQEIETPFGPAAGPHTQLAQNIICSWLSGGRFIELKTVQIMDELEIPRPCIDMEDEGYNVEWSQELKLEQSAAEYIHAWTAIHLLKDWLGLGVPGPVHTIFNMSVGYDLKGVRSPEMTRFMERLQDASREIETLRSRWVSSFPSLKDIPIPPRIASSVTLSTMHGCPPDEIEKIALYLMKDRGLHTTVKLNPTLIGRERLYDVLHTRLGYTDLRIPDSVFEHDLKYDAAVDLIRNLQRAAASAGVQFGVKLSNTLAMSNHKKALPGTEMYMSGRALYPVTMQLFQQIYSTFGDSLGVSFSAGADCLNVVDVISAGARPVTVASDLLKPGGYSRMLTFVETLEESMRSRGFSDLDQLSADRGRAVVEAAGRALTDQRYHRAYYPGGLPKTGRPLPRFDCIAAPCREACPVHQDVPEYIRAIESGSPQNALEIILRQNPLPGITGHICTHRCMDRCTRINYDQSVLIRHLKRFAFDNTRESSRRVKKTRGRAAVVGGGPAGLSAAYWLALHGVDVTVYEKRDRAGGMPALAPDFRIPKPVVDRDLDRIKSLGVTVLCGHTVPPPVTRLLDEGFDAVFVGIGYPKDSRLDLPGIEGKGVIGALELLHSAATKEVVDLGGAVLVVGGGNTAVDSARTAQRLIGRPVTIVYRRTRAEMPADAEEIDWFLEEGNQLMELVSPLRVIRESGRITALECLRNRLGDPGPDGRRSPEPVPGSEFLIPADTIVLAIGQYPDDRLVSGGSIAHRKNGRITVDDVGRAVDRLPVYAGGDAVRGPATIIEACADGRRAAESILEQLGIPIETPAKPAGMRDESELTELRRKRILKKPPCRPGELPAAERCGFEMVEQMMTPQKAMEESGRCLQCSVLCDKCVDVCPNRANVPVTVTPIRWELPVLVTEGRSISVSGYRSFELAQSRQILHIDDFCNECGNCAVFCTHQGKPYLDKPRVFFNKANFESETENAFYISGQRVESRTALGAASLEITDAGMLYRDIHVELLMDAGWKIIEASLKTPFEGDLDISHAATMFVVGSAVIQNGHIHRMTLPETFRG